MTLTTHAATGILVTQWTNNIWFGFFVGLMSHYITDAIPHGDEWIYWRHVHNRKDKIAVLIGSTDFLFLCALLYTVIEIQDTSTIPLVLMATAGAILPDFFITAHTNAREKFQSHYTKKEWIKKWYHFFLLRHYTFHMFCHNIMHTPIKYRTAISYQILFVFCFFYFYLVPKM